MHRSNWSARVGAAILVIASLVSVEIAQAQTPAPRPATPAAPAGVTVIRALNTSRRFSAPVRTLATLRRWATVNERDIRQVLSMAGLSSIADRVVAEAQKGVIYEATFAPGGRLPWMALRRLKKPDLARNVQWGGRQAFAAYRFVVTTETMVYTFLVPKDCGNLSLLSATPVPAASIPPVPPVGPARTTPAVIPAPAPPAPAPAPSQPPPAPPAPAVVTATPRPTPPPPPAPLPPPQAAPTAPVAPGSGMAGRAPFVQVTFGKQRRTLTQNDILGSYCDPLLGFKAGIGIPVRPRFMVAPAVGVALNLDDRSRTSLFADVELNRVFDSGSFVGGGVGLWDFNHGENATANLLAHAVIALSKHDDGQLRTAFAVEGRLFLDEIDNPANNYQFWAGIRYAFP